jgi:sodium/potassium-transporting ATPase subunit alpha
MEPIQKALLINGSDFARLRNKDWSVIISYEEIIFSRVTADMKLMIINKFREHGNVVGMLGDGINDAPALRQADISIVMSSGSATTLRIADLILIDNNLLSITFALENSRLIYENLRKAMLYLLPGSMVQLLPTLAYFLLGLPSNLSSLQSLVLSMFIDISPSLSLVMEKPEYDLLKKTKRIEKHLLSSKVVLQVLLIGSMLTFFSNCVYFWYLQLYAQLKPTDLLLTFGNFSKINHTDARFEYHKHVGQTVSLISIVMMQIFGNLLSIRTRRNSFFTQFPFGQKKSRNLFIMLAQFISFSILMFAIFVSFINELLETKPPPVEFFFIPFVFCLIIFSIDELRKLLARRKLFYFDKLSW